MATIIKPTHFFKGEVIRCIDGDTFICLMQTAFKQYYKDSVRLALLNTPELTNPDPLIRDKAYAAKDHLERYIPPGTKVIVDSKKLDPFGRPIALVYRNYILEEEVNNYMLKSGWEKYAITIPEKLLLPPKFYPHLDM